MKEILHIFRKDVRAARLQIVLGVVWITLFAYLDAEDTMTPSTYQTPLHQWSVLLTIFLPVVWWLLIAAGIFQEVIPGDTQFWLTRPYSRRRLIAAKLLFIAVFVNSALLLSDVFIMSSEAVPFTVGDLLQRQIGITVLAILPALALASVSRGLGQFVLIALLMVVGYVLESILISSWLHNPISIQVNEDSPQEDYTQLFLMALIFAGFLWWQYRRRMATLGRSIFAALILVALPLLFFVSPRAIYYIWTRDNVAEQPALAALTLHLETSGARKLPSTSGPLTEQRTFELPVTVDGMPKNLVANGYAEVEITATDATAKKWKMFSILHHADNGYWQSINGSRALFVEMKNHPLHVHADFTLTVDSEIITQRIPIHAADFRVDGVGVCQPVLDRQWPELFCRVGPHPARETKVSVVSGGFHGQPQTIGSDTRSRAGVTWAFSPVRKMPASFAKDSEWPNPLPQAAEFEFTQVTYFGQAKRTLDYQIGELESYALPDR